MTTKTKDIQFYSTQQIDVPTRREQRNGREYLVVPVVMLVEGVHSGSAGPVLHLAEHYSQNPEDWNKVPLTAGHPKNDNGEYVSVNQSNREEWIVGFVDNAHIDDGKLKAEAWIDERRAIAVNPEVVNYISEGRRLEVSTGMMTRDQITEGQYNGEDYERVTMEYHPDHLALLPGEQGACSWVDGCGIRTNQKEGSDEMSMLKEDIKKGLGVLNGLQNNQTGFIELSGRIQSMLDRRDSEARIHFLKELYEDYFVYEVRDRDQGTQKFFRQDYEFSEQQNDIDLDGGPEEVRRNVEFIPLQSNQTNEDACGCTMKRTKFTNNKDTEDSMSKEESKQPTGEVMDKVVSLMQNERTQFTKADREWLLELNEAQLDKLEPKEAPEPEVDREKAVQALQEDLSDINKLKELLPDNIKEKVEAGIQAYEEERSKLIKSIQANTDEETWPEKQLTAMETDTLQRLEKSVRKTDYSGQGPVTNNADAGSGDEVEMLLPAGVKLES